MAEVTQLNPNNFELQIYNPQDLNLIASSDINTILGDRSTIEFHIYDTSNNLIESNLSYQNYTLPPDGKNDAPNNVSLLSISPEKDLREYGYIQGEYITFYNFLNFEIGDLFNSLYISEISTDRQEIRLESSDLSLQNFIEQAENFIDKREESNYFLDFYLNFKNNNLIIANNIKLENENSNNPSILVKLYEPLPTQFNIKSTLFLVTNINEPEAFQVNFPTQTFSVKDYSDLKGPNFTIPVKDQVNNSSQNLSYTDIISSAPTSSQNQIDSLLSQSAVNISVDYNNFDDFIHFSSAQTRIENFYYKVGLIESYNNEINNLLIISSSATNQLLQKNKISKIIENFDRFEYFMYYSSGSMVSYPKSNSTQPYTLLPTTSSQVLTWLGSTDENNSNFGGQLLSASNFDNANPDQLKKAIPEYLREDPANQPYDLFIDMVAQYYDNIWLYTKDITQKYNADNRLDFGVSKDLVSDAIKDFGVKLYQNNFSNQELYTAFLGITPSGSLFPFPEITGSYPVPTGFEFVDTLISASNDVISMDDTNKSLYKRIYHNVPYLLKSKGTLAGLRALITSYGIPDTILKISEFGGKDKVNANDYDLYFNNFNYAFNTENNFIETSWEINPTWGSTNNKPSTVQFRFKSEKISSNISPFGLTNLSQSLWSVDDYGDPALLIIDYNGSGLDSGSLVNDSGSYDGSIKDPNYQVANLRFIPFSDNANESASISLPFYNGDWWSVMITTDQNGTYNLYAGNKIYNGNDGTSIGYYASASITGATNDYWINSLRSLFAEQNSSPAFQSYKSFSGLLQEIRYYNTQISESVFKDYIMNPLSFESNEINSAPDQLIFRAALGSELDITTSSSIHPKVTGSWAITSSFVSPTTSKFYFSNPPSYSKNTEYFFLDQPAAGIKNRTTDKIRSESNSLASGSILSPIRSLAQNTEASASYTDNINYLEVAFSPQNQINDDIIGQMGHFNIGDYIGDPAQRFTGNNYPDLNNLSEEYFKKYIKQYDLVDFVRLIKFFDNSLFKMIKDFIPARTSLASGLVVKQHLLERNKYPQPQVTQSLELLTGSIKSNRIWNTASQATEISSSLIESFNGGAAGMFNPFNISYDLDYFSGSETTYFNVSASSLDNLLGSLNLGDTFISGADGPPITNASSLSYFSTFVPNLYVQLNKTGNVLPFAFNSGSQPGPNINVSASGRFNTAVDNNTFNLLQQNTNVSSGTFSSFNNFSTSSFISASTDMFLNPSGSVETISASGNITIAGANTDQLTLDTFTSNAVLNQFPQFPGAFIVCDKNIFNNGLGTPVNSAQISSVLSADTIRTNLSTFGVETENINFNFRSGSSGGSTSFNVYSEGNSDKSMITDIQSTNLSTEFVTSSIFTNVSASGTITFTTAIGSELRFTLTSDQSNVSGGDMTNFQTFKDGYITTTNPIFSGSGPSTAIASASVQSLATGASNFKITGQLSPVLTPVSGSGDLSFFIGVSTGTTMSVANPNITNVSGNKLYNFNDFEDGYITTTNPIFSGSGPFTAVNSASINKIDNLFGGTTSFLLINATTSSILTEVSASGTATFSSNINPIAAGDLLVQSYSTNATDLNFSGFDDGNAYISCSSDAFGQYPFTGGLTGTGIALITNATNGAINVSISGRNGEYNANQGIITFAIMSGSAASVNSFISASQRPTISGEPFQIRSGSISQGTSGPIIFTSSSIRTSVTNEPFTFRTGSISQGTAGSTTFVSSSGRDTSGIAFEIHSGSYDNLQTFTNLGTTYVSASIIPVSHSRAQVASIGADDVINFASDWTINSIGVSFGEEFQLFDNATGSNNIFVSSSTQFEYRYNQLNQIPTPIFNITQSYDETFPSLLGPVTTIHNSQDEFYNGELSGSVILVSNGELNEGCADFKEVNPFLADYKVRVYLDTTFAEGIFLQNNNLPTDGYMQIFYGDEPGSPLAPVLPDVSSS